MMINIHLYRPFLQGLKGAKNEYNSQNQTKLYATENKYCFKSFLNWSINNRHVTVLNIPIEYII